MILRAEQFAYSIEKKAILQTITFALEAGERLAIIGPNGSGKTTLLKCFLRIHAGQAGALWVDDRSLELFPQKELARWLSYVPQAAGREDEFLVREFVLMGRYPHLSPFLTASRRDWEVVDHALELTGMQDFRQRVVRTLSGGEQQKVMIAAAVAQQAKVMLLDEPTAFLDPAQQDQIYTLLEDLHRQLNLTRVEVTHDVNRAALGHDRVLALKAGRVAFFGSPRELMEAATLTAIYGKRFELMPHPRTGRLVVMPGGDAWEN